MAKKCTKKHDARANLLFFLNKPIAVLTFSLPAQSSVLKLPINRRGLRILPGCCEYGPLLLSKENRRTNRTKRTCSCLIPLLLVVLIQQLQILVTTLVNCLLIVIEFPYLCQPLATETLNARNIFLMLLCCEVKAI